MRQPDEFFIFLYFSKITYAFSNDFCKHTVTMIFQPRSIYERLHQISLNVNVHIPDYNFLNLLLSFIAEMFPFIYSFYHYKCPYGNGGQLTIYIRAFDDNDNDEQR